jgi:hypothetical protein
MVSKIPHKGNTERKKYNSRKEKRKYFPTIRLTLP